MALSIQHPQNNNRNPFCNFLSQKTKETFFFISKFFLKRWTWVNHTPSLSAERYLPFSSFQDDDVYVMTLTLSSSRKWKGLLYFNKEHQKHRTSSINQDKMFFSLGQWNWWCGVYQCALHVLRHTIIIFGIAIAWKGFWREKVSMVAFCWFIFLMKPIK